MSQPIPLVIRGSGASFAVLQGAKVLRHFNSHIAAIAALRGLEARLQTRHSRRCLCCPATFMSTGPGHRLCAKCRVAE